jgi:hypothetical protein
MNPMTNSYESPAIEEYLRVVAPRLKYKYVIVQQWDARATVIRGPVFDQAITMKLLYGTRSPSDAYSLMDQVIRSLENEHDEFYRKQGMEAAKNSPPAYVKATQARTVSGTYSSSVSVDYYLNQRWPVYNNRTYVEKPAKSKLKLAPMPAKRMIKLED